MKKEYYSRKGTRGKKGAKRRKIELKQRTGTFNVESEVQGSRNSDLQFISKAVQRSWKHSLSQGSHRI